MDNLQAGDRVLVVRGTSNLLEGGVYVVAEVGEDDMVTLREPAPRMWYYANRFQKLIPKVDGSVTPKFSPRQVVRARVDWRDQNQDEDLWIRKGEFFHVSSTMGNTISLAEKDSHAWYFEDQFEALGVEPEPPAEVISLRESVAELAQALLDTHERLGKSVMPDSEGWAWYDALKKHAPEFLPKYRCKAILSRDRVAPGVSGDWYVRCDKDAPHAGEIHDGGGWSWGDNVPNAAYLADTVDG